MQLFQNPLVNKKPPVDSDGLFRISSSHSSGKLHFTGSRHDPSFQDFLAEALCPYGK